MKDTRTIEIPNWCYIGVIVKVKYPKEITGSNEYYKEEIIGYSDDGFFTQGYSCPVYHHTFDEWGKTIKPV